eukprot:CAMPEP_0197625124 /NCGR_PEP_ID=MMETSP1338-20131121/4571_1 /TAXON_ID=43686 ORGANISM="Pelagodinium beii, Strain RCC1491" /NCGR_SAMPLE_ID=MMETSP1338 /ASSEMBLY_ACC=CAM_ASM_000754 /LENGTH=35 /DNA_ID= /DNA_START= /DNA_END= /DNA_ORIENTATION=
MSVTSYGMRAGTCSYILYLTPGLSLMSVFDFLVCS